jgi:tRNA(fMet)-specific endonuclease VapC
MNRCLLDTDILSEIIKGRDLAVVSCATTYLETHERLTTSAVSVAEIIYGLRRVGREDRLHWRTP